MIYFIGSLCMDKKWPHKYWAVPCCFPCQAWIHVHSFGHIYFLVKCTIHTNDCFSVVLNGPCHVLQHMGFVENDGVAFLFVRLPGPWDVII